MAVTPVGSASSVYGAEKSSKSPEQQLNDYRSQREELKKDDPTVEKELQLYLFYYILTFAKQFSSVLRPHNTCEVFYIVTFFYLLYFEP